MKIIENPQLKDYSSLRIGGEGKVLYIPESISDLQEIPQEDKESCKVFAGGSNVVFADNVTTPLIYTGKLNKDLFTLNKTPSGATIKIGAGFSLQKAVNKTVQLELAGLERLCGIPGTIGGAVVMNAGTAKSWISDNLLSTEIYDLESDTAFTFNKNELQFSYRSSVLQSKSRWVLLSADFSFTESNARILKQVTGDTLDSRTANKIEFPNCGSVFRNPENNKSAGELIDALGLKGLKVGGLQISHEHANICVNSVDATYSDFVELTSRVTKGIREKFDIDLELEIKVID